MIKLISKLFLLFFLQFYTFQSVAQQDKTFKWNDSELKVGTVYCLTTTFRYNNASVMVDSTEQEELQNLASFLKSHPNCILLLEIHTDIRGAASYNMRLSQRRAEMFHYYLCVNFQVNSNQLKAKGFGESKPIYSKEYIATLTEDKAIQDAHQANRRVLVRIIDI